jgi:hypothetical protein
MVGVDVHQFKELRGDEEGVVAGRSGVADSFEAGGVVGFRVALLAVEYDQSAGDRRLRFRQVDRRAVDRDVERQEGSAGGRIDGEGVVGDGFDGSVLGVSDGDGCEGEDEECDGVGPGWEHDGWLRGAGRDNPHDNLRAAHAVIMGHPGCYNR